MKTARNCEIRIDGSSQGNPGPSGVGIVFFDKASAPSRRFSKHIGEATNNVAEYLAFIYALVEALREGYTSLVVKTDSELLARQVGGRYKVRDQKLKLLHDLAMELSRSFSSCSLEHIPRTQNAIADQLAYRAAQDSA